MDGFNLETCTAWNYFLQSVTEKNRQRYKNVATDYVEYCRSENIPPEDATSAVNYLRTLRDERNNALETVRGKKAVIARFYKVVYEKPLDVVVQVSSEFSSQDSETYICDESRQVPSSSSSGSRTENAPGRIVNTPTTPNSRHESLSFMNSRLPKPLSVSSMPNKLALSSLSSSSLVNVDDIMAKSSTSIPGGTASAQLTVPLLPVTHLSASTRPSTAALASTTGRSDFKPGRQDCLGGVVSGELITVKDGDFHKSPSKLSLNINTKACKSLSITLGSSQHVDLIIDSGDNTTTKSLQPMNPSPKKPRLEMA